MSELTDDQKLIGYDKYSPPKSPLSRACWFFNDRPLNPGSLSACSRCAPEMRMCGVDVPAKPAPTGYHFGTLPTTNGHRPKVFCTVHPTKVLNSNGKCKRCEDNEWARQQRHRLKLSEPVKPKEQVFCPIHPTKPLSKNGGCPNCQRLKYKRKARAAKPKGKDDRKREDGQGITEKQIARDAYLKAYRQRPEVKERMDNRISDIKEDIDALGKCARNSHCIVAAMQKAEKLISEAGKA